ncbi:hypothetical protein SAMN05660653_02368 [Desulfonatronum thiosulfatophilum]|uniref:Nucleotidyltransferase substrate binding protein, HI0074 family n=1 Tax=Desulfonatronum thiosulfatophilum TaxID=617002 RepID=A0A1G6DSN8_9BACT|nr:hypothetical protein [Desulfonatronum thiosulfatophilum]SDB48120.1 hypothetical protein SAMN05660653_02368 [Desulfonatronum thiosulfatophilum]
MNHLLEESQRHLGELLTAVERCIYFLEGARSRVSWPLTGDELSARNKDLDLFTNLSAVNERYAKLQDTLGTAMRHAALLAGEPTENFLRVLAFFEKNRVLESVKDWQAMRALRNLAAHEYGTNYAITAEHFNAINSSTPVLYRMAAQFSRFCANNLAVTPSTSDFSRDVEGILQAWIER